MLTSAVARFRIRYQSTDLEMPVGDFVVGRSSSCHLALDDALVSRRHAVFHVSADGLTVEDLGSRNGVLVNGEQIAGSLPLKHLDRVIIGAQELLVVQVHDGGARERGNHPTLAGMTLDLPVINPEFADEPTAHHGGSVLDRIADKALALGRFEEAERMLSRRMDEMVEEARSGGRKPEPDKLLAATNYALQLAAGTGKARWIDWIFDAHDACEAMIDAEVIDRLHTLVRQTRYPGGAKLRQYMANLRARANRMSKGELFLVRRLEGIERVVGA